MKSLRQSLRKYAHPEKARILQGFFKTGRGEYGEGDIFIGVKVPETRKVAREFLHLSFQELEKILQSKIHEERLAALLILVEKFRKASDEEKKRIYDFYIKNRRYANNWDLVDLTADKIAGAYLLKRDKSILYKLAKSDNLWERRIAIVSTFHLIKNNQFEETFRISQILLQDKHDLIQKAVGWMLREIGKRDFKAENDFLKKTYRKMPRIMLRYSIERFPEKLRESYLLGRA